MLNFLLNKKSIEESLWNELCKMPGLLIVVTDEFFKLARANDYFYEYFNCKPSDVAGRYMHGFLGEDIKGDMSTVHIEKALEKGHIWDHKSRTLDANGEPVVISWNQLVFNAQNKRWILSIGFFAGQEVAEALPSSTSSHSSPFSPFSPNRDSWGIDISSKTSAKANQKPADEPLLEPDLDKWISGGSFIMHYQPRVSARTKAITGAEGLIRMDHPEYGILYPASFLPRAEKTNHIMEIGNYVLDAVCKKLERWKNNGKNNNELSISINVSPRQLFDESFMQTMLQVVSKYQIDPSSLMVELTEKTIATYHDDIVKVIHMLKDAGFKITIDDYSAGFLPVSSLARLPVDNITFDRAYLAQSDKDQVVRSVMESIIVLAHSINMTVTAQGVENRRQLDFLLDNSVDYLQGYLISKPMPEQEFDRFLDTNPDFYTRHI